MYSRIKRTVVSGCMILSLIIPSVQVGAREDEGAYVNDASDRIKTRIRILQETTAQGRIKTKRYRREIAQTSFSGQCFWDQQWLQAESL